MIPKTKLTLFLCIALGVAQKTVVAAAGAMAPASQPTFLMTAHRADNQYKGSRWHVWGLNPVLSAIGAIQQGGFQYPNDVRYEITVPLLQMRGYSCIISPMQESVMGGEGTYFPHHKVVHIKVIKTNTREELTAPAVAGTEPFVLSTLAKDDVVLIQGVCGLVWDDLCRMNKEAFEVHWTQNQRSLGARALLEQFKREGVHETERVLQREPDPVRPPEISPERFALCRRMTDDRVYEEVERAYAGDATVAQLVSPNSEAVSRMRLLAGGIGGIMDCMLAQRMTPVCFKLGMHPQVRGSAETISGSPLHGFSGAGGGRA